MGTEPVRIGIVGLGNWAKVLTRASVHSSRFKIVCGYSRSAENRQAYTAEFGISCVEDFDEMLRDPQIKGVILTVPNEHHLPVAQQVAEAGKQVYTEKPIANSLIDGLKMQDLQVSCGVKVMVGHSARLLKGTRLMREAIDAGELGTVSFMEANFSNERALELTPDTWRWYRDKAPGGPLSQLAIHQFDSLHYLGGEITHVSSIASKLSPVGAEVDDQSMTLMKFADGKLAYVGACWTSPGIYAIRVFGSAGLMHYELDLGNWNKPENLHLASKLYIQRGKDGFGKREEITLPEGNMLVDELDLFAGLCSNGELPELTAQDGVAALGVVNAALRSIDQNGQLIAMSQVLDEARMSIQSENMDVA